MLKFNLFNHNARRTYTAPEKPSALRELIDKMWETIHIVIIPELILQDGKIEQIKGQNRWQLIFLGLILTVLGLLLGLYVSGRFS